MKRLIDSLVYCRQLNLLQGNEYYPVTKHTTAHVQNSSDMMHVCLMESGLVIFHLSLQIITADFTVYGQSSSINSLEERQITGVFKQLFTGQT